MQAERVARETDGGAEFHHGLVEISGALGIDEFVGEALDLGGAKRGMGLAVGGCAVFGHASLAEEDAFDVAVDDGGGFSEGDAGDGGRCVSADAGELAEFGGGLGELAVVFGDDGLCSLMQEAGRGGSSRGRSRRRGLRLRWRLRALRR